MVDINLDEGAPTVNADVKLIIQQIDMLFDTKKHTVLGSPNYGTNYEEFLFNLNLSNDAIAYQIQCDLGLLELFDYQPSVSVSILEGTLNDIILVNISLTKNDDCYEKTYVLQ